MSSIEWRGRKYTVPTYTFDPPEAIPTISRIERADTLLNQIQGVTGQYLRRGGVDYEPVVDGDGHMWLFGRVRHVVPPVLPVLVGEFLYELRAYLDNIVWTLSAKPRTYVTGFPVALTKESWESKRTRGKIASVSEHVRATIDLLQPYHAADPKGAWLRLLDELAKADRHRTLQLLPMLVSSATLHVSGPIPSTTPMPLIELGQFVPGAHLGTFLREGRWKREGLPPLDLEFDLAIPELAGHPGGRLIASLEALRVEVEGAVRQMHEASD